MPKPALLEAFAAHTAAVVDEFDASDYGTVLAEHDASDTATLTNAGGGAVSAWAKKSGSLSATLAQGTGSARPTMGTTSQNGLGTLDFDGGDFLSVDFADEAQPVTVAIVLKSDNVDSGNRQAFGNFSNPSATVFVNSDTYRYYAGTERSSGVTEDGNWHIIVAIFNGASSSFWLDGVQRVTTDPGSAACKGISIGADPSGGSFWNGQIGHSILYDGAVADPAGLSDGLNDKWAVY